MSRTGIELPAQSVDPFGRAAASAGNGAPSNGSSSPASQASIASTAARSARQPFRGPRRVAAPARGPRGDRAARSAAGSAWTKVAGTSADSRHPDPPSSTISSGVVRASSSVIGLEVGMAPVRMTRSGAMGVDPGARPNELVRACDHQAPVVAARSGGRTAGPRESGSRSRPRGPPAPRGGAGSSSGPATMRPRSAPARRPASASIAASSRVRRPSIGGRERSRVDALVRPADRPGAAARGTAR